MTSATPTRRSPSIAELAPDRSATRRPLALWPPSRPSLVLAVLVLIAAGAARLAHAASPPALVNYQGVLRDASNTPRTGVFDMVFRFYNMSAGGDEILVDRHTALDGNPVTVGGGLFTTLLGGGIIADGSGPGVYGNLSQAFRDYPNVFVSIEVGGEVLAPRVRIVSAAFALNSDSVDGIDATQLLRSDTSSSVTAGTLTVSPASTLNVAGSLQIGGAAVTPDAAELNKLDGTGATVTAASLTTLTSGGSADALHTHASVANAGNANTLDALDSAQFLRSDADDSFTGGSLTMNGSLRMDDDEAGDQSLYFYEGGSPTGAYLRRDDTQDRFEMNDDLHIFGSIRVGSDLTQAPVAYNRLDALGGISTSNSGEMNNASDLFIAGDIEVNNGVFLSGSLNMKDAGPDANQEIRFYEDGLPSGEILRWSDDPREQFEVTDDFAVLGRLAVGSLPDSTGASAVTFSHFSVGGDTPDSLDMSTSTDVYIEDDLEVDETLYLNAQVRMDDDGPDGNQFIYFYNGGSATGESLSLDDAQDRFELTDDLAIEGVLVAGSALPTFTYNRFGAVLPVSTDMTTVGDVMISEDLEVGQTSYLKGAIVVTDSTPTAGQSFSSFGEATSKTSSDVSLSNDVFIEGDLEVGDRLYVPATIVVGDASPASNQAYSSFGEGSVADTSIISTSSDVFIREDLEVLGLSYATRFHGEVGLPASLVADDALNFMVDDDSNDGGAEFVQWYKNGSYTNANKLADLSQFGDLRLLGDLSEQCNFSTGVCAIPLAESFLKVGPAEPGDLVSVDASRPDAVRLTSSEGDPAVLGVVTGKPGILLGGAPFDVEALAGWGPGLKSRFLGEAAALRKEVLAASPELQAKMEALSEERAPRLEGPRPRRAVELGRMLDDRLEEMALQRFFARSFVSVALVGKALVKIDARGGEIRPGDPLGPSAIPGVAMKVTRAGPVIGTALGSFTGGIGTVLALMGRGSFVPPDGGAHAPEAAAGGSGASTASGRSSDGQALANASSFSGPMSGIRGALTHEGSLKIVLSHGDLSHGDEGGSSLSVSVDEGQAVASEVFRVDEDGNVHARGSFQPASLGLAELHEVTEPVEAGDVLVVDRTRPGRLCKGTVAADGAVVGIVTGEPGVLMGSGFPRIASGDSDVDRELEDARTRGDRVEGARLRGEIERRFAGTHAAVAVSGTVLCKVDAAYGPIRIGDLLAASPTPGRAMRSADAAPGTVLGKALEPHESGTGVIRVLVMLR